MDLSDVTADPPMLHAFEHAADRDARSTPAFAFFDRFTWVKHIGNRGRRWTHLLRASIAP
ncbi:MAG: hypothetical protein H6723_11785 [Sandaracinus sp.]|nr:hypothetical protein [Sandaracinus sp.]